MRSAVLPYTLKVRTGDATYPRFRLISQPRRLRQACLASLRGLRDTLQLEVPDGPLDGGLFRWRD